MKRVSHEYFNQTDEFVNIYDQGIWSNIFSYFDNRLFLFWFPTRLYSYDDGKWFYSGYGFPRNPVPPLSSHRKFTNYKKDNSVNYDLSISKFQHDENESARYVYQFNHVIYWTWIIFKKYIFIIYQTGI